VQVVCANSNGASLGVSGNSPTFGITTADLVLLNPGRGSRFANGGVVRVAWKATGAVTSVNIFVKSGAGAETQVATNVAGTSYRDITLPGGVSDSSQVTVRIQNSASTSHQDSVDGYFMVRGTSPGFTNNFTGQTLQVGSIQLLDWHGRSDSYTVDLDLVGTTTISIAKNLTDFGSFMWLVPDSASSSSVVRAIFKNATGATVATVNTGAFAIVRGSAGPPPPPPPPSNTNMAPVRRDFDGDGRGEIAVFRPSTGTWFVRYSASSYNPANATADQWGLQGDIPISADFDGDRKIEMTVYRPSTGTWYIRYSTQGYALAGAQAVQWGAPGDLPIVADFDGDGRSELTVYRPSTGTWYIRFSTQGHAVGGAQALQWGAPGDIPVTGDFDGDGKTELTVYRPSTGTWYVRFSTQGYNAGGAQALQWGAPGDLPIIGDFDGDGKTDLTVFRPANGVWYIRLSSQAFAVGTAAAIQWGLNGDVPAPSDFDGDGKSDIVVFRPGNGTWYVLNSSTGFAASSAVQWGLPGDEVLR
jgi:FG-GAP-like repeat